jgi:hypothetical protein
VGVDEFLGFGTQREVCYQDGAATAEEKGGKGEVDAWMI